MPKSVDIERQSNGAVIITVNSGVPRSINDDVNIQIKAIDNFSGCVIKSISDDFQLRLFLVDTITINGAPAPTNISDLITVLTNWVFSGTNAYATPTKLTQTITFGALTTLAHTAPAFNAGATASSGLGVTYVSSDPTKATVGATTGVITPVAAGSTNITASQAGNAYYAAATPVVQALTLT